MPQAWAAARPGEVSVRVLAPDPSVRARIEAALNGATIAVSVPADPDAPVEIGEVLVVDRLTAERAGLVPGVPGAQVAPKGTAPSAAELLKEVARARHALNNRLTAALAEVQLVMLDPPDGELGESFEIIHRQLYAIRNEVANSLNLGPVRDD